MRWRVGLVMTMACLTAACGSSGNVDSARQTLLALDREWSQQVKDMDKFMAKFAQEGSLNLPGVARVSGREPIRHAANAFGEVPGFSIRWTPAKADVGTGADLGYTAGTYRITRDDPATGRPAAEAGKYVSVWKKDGRGNWKVVEFIFNADGPPQLR